MSPLSHLQKSLLARLASRAYARQCALDRGAGRQPDASYKAFDEFRRAQVILACGKHGLRCCDQGDYKLVEAHFLNLLGEAPLSALIAADTEPRRQAEYKLLAEIKAAQDVGITIGYAEAICMTQNKCHILELNTKQLWNLFYTVKNRADAKRRQRARSTHEPSDPSDPSEAHQSQAA